MPTQVQRRRGTTTEHSTFTGAVGEITVDTTKKTAVVHDGSTAGGLSLAREDLSNVGTVAVSKGGTGATTAANALTNLGAYPASNPSGYITSSGTLTGNVASTGGDFAIKNSTSSTATLTWHNRTGVINAGVDRAVFVGTYGSSAIVGAHNAALNAWADLYVNTPDGFNGGTVRMPSSVLVNGNQVLHAGNYNSYAPTLTGTGASGTWGISVTGNAANVTGTVAVANGGTGATTLTSGAYLKGAGTSAVTAQTGIPAGDITSGTVGTARLGSGTANSTTFLRGDQTWATVSATQTVNTYDTGTAATWTKPTNATWVQIEIWGGGGSGGKGAGSAPAGGGGGGGYHSIIVPLADLQGSVTYTVGAGAAAKTTTGTGNVGGTSSVTMNTFQGGSAKTLSAYGGGGGYYIASNQGGGGGGGGQTSAGASGTGASTGGTGGGPGGGFGADGVNFFPPMPGSSGGGGGGGASLLAGAGSLYGGGGGGAGGASIGSAGGGSTYGGGGGGGGGATTGGAAGGESIWGGAGSAGTTSTTVSSDGTLPAGGSGGTEGGNSGAGGGGRVRFTYW